MSTVPRVYTGRDLELKLACPAAANRPAQRGVKEGEGRYRYERGHAAVPEARHIHAHLAAAAPSYSAFQFLITPGKQRYTTNPEYGGGLRGHGANARCVSARGKVFCLAAIRCDFSWPADTHSEPLAFGSTGVSAAPRVSLLVLRCTVRIRFSAAACSESMSSCVRRALSPRV